MDKRYLFLLLCAQSVPLKISHLHKSRWLIFSVGVTGFEPATTRPPDVYSNRAELHPAAEKQCKCRIKKSVFKILSGLFLLSGPFPCFRKQGNACITGEKSLSERQARVARLGLNPLRDVTGRRSDGPIPSDRSDATSGCRTEKRHFKRPGTYPGYRPVAISSSIAPSPSGETEKTVP